MTCRVNYKVVKQYQRAEILCWTSDQVALEWLVKAGEVDQRKE